MEIELDEPETAVLPSFEEFFRSTFAHVARAAALVARDPGVGQELAQEALFRLYQRWGRIESEEHARRFAYRVAVNLARSHVRKHVRVALSGLEPGGKRAREVPTDDMWLDISSALGTLSPRQRSAVVLVDYVGMESAEAAAILGIGAGTVRTHLLRGRTALRGRLERA